MDEKSMVDIFSDGANLLKGKATLYEAHNISQEAMASIYAMSHELYTNRKYQDAEKSFELLCLYDHKNAKYWKGLGYSRQVLKKYKEGAAALGYASVYADEYDSGLHLSMAECLIMAGQPDTAELYLKELIEKSSEGGPDDKNEQRARLLCDQLHEDSSQAQAK